MSREIKFRAWDELEKRMWTLDDAGEDSGDDSIQYFSENGSLEFGRLEYYDTGLGINSHFEKFPLMQYTGLKDKNGKEIYEGDIVEYNDFNSLRTGGHTEDKIIVGKVVFSCGMWMVEAKNCGHDLYEGLVNDEELEIIGNIYDNPGILEETA